MQSKNENILTLMDKLVAVTKKIILWKNSVKSCDLDMFPLVRKSCIKEMLPIITVHLACLENKIK